MALTLTTKENVKAHADISVTTHDTEIDRLILVAQEEIQQITGRQFDSAARTQDVDGHGTREVIVPETPITTLTSVSILFPDGTTSALSSTGYTFGKHTGIITRVVERPGIIGYEFGSDIDAATFPNRANSVRVVYTAGYSAISDDPALEQACIDVVLYMFRARHQDRTVVSENLGSGSVKYNQDSDEVEEFVQRRVRRWISRAQRED